MRPDPQGKIKQDKPEVPSLGLKHLPPECSPWLEMLPKGTMLQVRGFSSRWGVPCTISQRAGPHSGRHHLNQQEGWREFMYVQKAEGSGQDTQGGLGEEKEWVCTHLHCLQTKAELSQKRVCDQLSPANFRSRTGTSVPLD